MKDINIILHNSITSFKVKRVSMSMSIPTCESEKPTPTNDRHFPDIGEHGVAPQHTESAAIILAFSESKVEHH